MRRKETIESVAVMAAPRKFRNYVRGLLIIVVCLPTGNQCYVMRSIEVQVTVGYLLATFYGLPSLLNTLAPFCSLLLCFPYPHTLLPLTPNSSSSSSPYTLHPPIGETPQLPLVIARQVSCLITIRRCFASTRNTDGWELAQKFLRSRETLGYCYTTGTQTRKAFAPSLLR